MIAKRIWLVLALMASLSPIVLLTGRTHVVSARTDWANAGSQANLSTEEGQTYPLAMGAGNTRVGDVRIRHDSTHLYVEYRTDPQYSLSAVHVCASTTTFGWTAPGQCPYAQSAMPPAKQQYSFAIPLAEIGASCGLRVFLPGPGHWRGDRPDD